MLAQATLAICSLGRPSLFRTVRAACSGDVSCLAEVLLLDNSQGALAADELRAAASAVPCRILPGAPTTPGGRNRLIAEVRTDLVCFTDDDCIPDPGWLPTLTAYLAACPDVAAAFGRVEPTPRPDARIRVVPIDGLGEVAWGEAGTDDDPLFCPAISAPTWRPGVVTGPPTVPWAVVGSSNNLGIRRSLLLPGRPPFLPSLGPGSRAGAGEDTEFGYALMAAGHRVAYVPDALVLHDSWLRANAAEQKHRSYFRSNTEALAYHALRRDARAGELLTGYWAHFCEVHGFAELGDVLAWAYSGQ